MRYNRVLQKSRRITSDNRKKPSWSVRECILSQRTICQTERADQVGYRDSVGNITKSKNIARKGRIRHLYGAPEIKNCSAQATKARDVFDERAVADNHSGALSNQESARAVCGVM